ncbi:putative galactinol--sucrose galactosyltransferase 1-like [Hibiscus syriacus]|uniref:Galactinol--sucrose galactosyltransferase 1-like n=1 Tax=Hibiscus syriacus TaxID=106335 RepID=A0A6A3BDJ5_HIBSY|nr:putative galactinol--sucrose galactosyltransferase 1-like [Hibiscus syriacus]
MVGSGSADRSKDAVGMMALHEALRTVCLNSDWTYSVFWTIVLAHGFCKGRVADCLEEIDGEDPVRKAFSKMSIQLYNYGEGWVLGRLMGKVASDKCHKWVFKEPTESEPNISNYWQSSFDALPPEWTDQFDSGIQTIAVIQAGHGLLQLGSCKIIPEDLHFVLRMRHTFESPGYQSGFYLSQLFSSNRNGSSLSTIPSKQSTVPMRPPPPLFNWSQRPLPPATNPMLASLNFQNPGRLGFQQPQDETHMFLLPRSSETRMEDMMVEHENDIKWPNGLSFFTALTGRTEDAKLLFNSESLGNKPETNDHPLILDGKDSNQNSDAGANPNEFLSLDSHPENTRNMENKLKKNFPIPARMATSSSSTSVDHHQHQTREYRNSEPGMYTDVMETFLD